jgi:outer membrane protein OmpA-like peptidoglycan-associated protein
VSPGTLGTDVLTILDNGNVGIGTSSPIAKLSGTRLPSNLDEGYYIAANGDVIILTRHLTSFATKLKRSELVVTTTETTYTVGENFLLSVSGIQDSAEVNFESTTPNVCQVNSEGKVVPSLAGECNIAVSVPAAGNYMAAYSNSNKFIIEKVVVTSSPAKPVALSVKQTGKLIGSVYFPRNTSALDQKALVALKKILDKFKSYQSFTIKLVGHSYVNKSLNNSAITLARGKTVAEYFKNKVIGKIQIVNISAKDVSSPNSVNDSIYRLVEVWVIPSNK